MLSVLIVEDEYRISRMLTQMIDWASLGCAIVGVASDGLEGVRKIEKTNPDIVITDVKMSGCSGLEMAAKVMPDHPDIDLIIISGYRYFENAHNAIKMGIKHYLLKPIEEEELIAALEDIKAERADETRRTQSHDTLQRQVTL